MFRRLPVISQRIMLWSQKLLTLPINIPSRNWYSHFFIILTGFLESRKQLFFQFCWLLDNLIDSSYLRTEQDWPGHCMYYQDGIHIRTLVCRTVEQACNKAFFGRLSLTSQKCCCFDLLGFSGLKWTKDVTSYNQHLLWLIRNHRMPSPAVRGFWWYSGISM